MKTSWKRLPSLSLEGVFKTSLRHLDPGKHICFSHTSLEDVFKTSSIRLDQDQYTRLRHTSSRRSQKVFKTSSRLLPKMSLRRLQYILPRRLQNVFEMSTRRLAKASSRYRQDVLQRYLQVVFKTYHQVKLFLLARLQDVFDMYSVHFLRCTAKTVIYRTICLGHTSIKNLWLVYKICKSDKTVSSFNLSLNYNF